MLGSSSLGFVRRSVMAIGTSSDAYLEIKAMVNAYDDDGGIERPLDSRGQLDLRVANARARSLAKKIVMVADPLSVGARRALQTKLLEHPEIKDIVMACE